MENVTHAYFYFLIFFVTALIVSAAALKFAAYLSFKLFGRYKQTVKNDGYAGGFYILSSVTSRFPVRFAFVALLFVLFNAEFLLLLPWAMSLRLSEGQGIATALLVVVFVVIAAGIGTGGTAFGLKEYLKNAIVFGVEPAESPLFTEGHAGPHAIQGIGANFIPKISEGKHLDGILTVKGEDAIAQARELAQKHGIFCGISAGANVCAAQELTKKYPDKLIVAIIPDSGERYLSVW